MTEADTVVSLMRLLPERFRDNPACFVVELGVFKGRTLKAMAGEWPSGQRGPRVRGFDSFEGLAEPSPQDDPLYPKGRFAISASEVCKRLGEQHGNVLLVHGWIPESLELPELARLVFAHVDLDHAEPMRAGLAWCWERMESGGILAAHDWFPEDGDVSATWGINRFMEIAGPGTFVEATHHVWWVKP